MDIFKMSKIGKGETLCTSDAQTTGSEHNALKSVSGWKYLAAYYFRDFKDLFGEFLSLRLLGNEWKRKLGEKLATNILAKFATILLVKNPALIHIY